MTTVMPTHSGVKRLRMLRESYHARLAALGLRVPERQTLPHAAGIFDGPPLQHSWPSGWLDQSHRLPDSSPLLHQVWALRVDVHILDHHGNLADAASLSALAALLAFRRPEATLEAGDSGEGQQVVVHPPEVREPLPLSIHHTPLCITFASFQVSIGLEPCITMPQRADSSLGHSMVVQATGVRSSCPYAPSAILSASPLPPYSSATSGTLLLLVCQPAHA